MTLLTNQNLLELNALLVSLNEVKNLKVAWMVAQNLNRLVPHLKIIQDMLAPTEAMKSFETKRQSMSKSFVKKDEAGNTIEQSDPRNPKARLYVIEDVAGYNAALSALLDEHPEAKVDSEALQKKEIELLKESVEIDLYTLNVENTKSTSEPENSVLDANSMLILLWCGILKE